VAPAYRQARAVVAGFSLRILNIAITHPEGCGYEILHITFCSNVAAGFSLRSQAQPKGCGYK